MVIRIEAILVGRPQNFSTEDDSKSWTSAILEQLVEGPVHAHTSNIAGDQQADLVHHGGPDKAVCGYAAQNYEHWSPEFAIIDWQAAALERTSH
jgi:MOSC domain-containing protein YiiM